MCRFVLLPLTPLLEVLNDVANFARQTPRSHPNVFHVRMQCCARVLGMGLGEGYDLSNGSRIGWVGWWDTVVQMLLESHLLLRTCLCQELRPPFRGLATANKEVQNARSV
jgi:hypothetical protein